MGPTLQAPLSFSRCQEENSSFELETATGNSSFQRMTEGKLLANVSVKAEKNLQSGTAGKASSPS